MCIRDSVTADQDTPMRPPLLAALLAAICLPLAACGGGESAKDPKELYSAASKAYLSKSYADAVKHAGDAIGGMGDATGKLRKDAELLLAKASAHVEPGRARTAFQDVAAENPDLFGVDDFADVANALMDSEGGLTEAATLIDAAKGVFPNAAGTFGPIQALIQARIDAGEVSESEKSFLESLGYL